MLFQIMAFHAVFLTFIAILVRFIGDFPILSGSSDSGKDLAKLNKYAGNRLLLLPVLAFVLARLSLESAAAGVFSLMILWGAIFVVIIWISIGSQRL